VDERLALAGRDPIFFAILPAITLSGIPDYSADRAVGKGTIAVRLGRASPSGVPRRRPAWRR
jgi:hypothetical protein